MTKCRRLKVRKICQKCNEAYDGDLEGVKESGTELQSERVFSSWLSSSEIDQNIDGRFVVLNLDL